MNWLAFGVILWLAFGIELGLRDAVRVGDIAPSAVIPLVVYVSLALNPRQAAWVALIAGALIDITWTIDRPGETVGHTVGPWAIGLLAGVQLVIALRGLLIRRHPLSLAALSLGCALIAQIVVTAIMSFRAVAGDSIEWVPASQLGARVLSAAATGMAAAILWVPLRLADPLLGLSSDRARRF